MSDILLVPTTEATPEDINKAILNLQKKIDNITVSPSTVPTGAITAYCSAIAPTGWLVCDGTAISRARYSTLFDILGVTFGSGDGFSTFNLPNLQDAFLRGEVGLSTSQFTDSTKRGAGLGVKQDDNFQSHWHDFYVVTNAATGGGADNSGAAVTLRSNAVQNPVTDGTHGTPRTGFETRPKNVGVNFIIKT